MKMLTQSRSYFKFYVSLLSLIAVTELFALIRVMRKIAKLQLDRSQRLFTVTALLLRVASIFFSILSIWQYYRAKNVPTAYWNAVLLQQLEFCTALIASVPFLRHIKFIIGSFSKAWNSLAQTVPWKDVDNRSLNNSSKVVLSPARKESGWLPSDCASTTSNCPTDIGLHKV
jgi:hypothetical protein